MRQLILTWLLVVFVYADDSFNRMLEKQLSGTAKYGKNNTTTKITPTPSSTPNPPPTLQHVSEKKWYKEERFKNTISGDRRIDALFAGFGIDVIFDIDRHERQFVAFCDSGTKEIHMKPIDYYSSNDYYVEVLLHELGHCIEHSDRVALNYKYNPYTKNYYYKIEELIADKYATRMGKILGYKNIGSYGSNHFINNNTRQLKQQGAMMGSIDYYVSRQVNNAISKSKAIIRQKIK